MRKVSDTNNQPLLGGDERSSSTPRGPAASDPPPSAGRTRPSGLPRPGGAGLAAQTAAVPEPAASGFSLSALLQPSLRRTHKREAFDREVDAWVGAATPDKASGRRLAGLRIKDAQVRQTESLELNRLHLGTLPACLSKMEALRSLKVNANDLVALPTLPTGLKHLEAADNRLAELPKMDYSHFLVLYLKNNRLEKLPESVCYVQTLNVGKNRLTEAPPISNRMSQLNLSHNRLTALPESQRMTARGCTYVNKERTLAYGLTYLNLTDNALTDWPEGIETNLKNTAVHIDRNPWSEQALQALPTMREHAVELKLEGGPEAVRSVKTRIAISHWHPDATGATDAASASGAAADLDPAVACWDALQGEPKAAHFSDFLIALRQQADRYRPRFPPDLQRQIGGLLTAMEKSPELRTRCFNIAAQSPGTVHNQVPWGLSCMRLAEIEENARSTLYSPRELHTIGLGVFRRQLLEQLADADCARQSVLNRLTSKVDSIDARVGFFKSWSHELSLPGRIECSWDGNYPITDQKKETVFAEIKRRSSQDEATIFLLSWAPWVEALSRQYPAALAQISAQQATIEAGLPRRSRDQTDAQWQTMIDMNHHRQAQARIDVLYRLTREAVATLDVNTPMPS